MMKTTMSLAVLALIGEISAVELKNANLNHVESEADGMNFNFLSSEVDDGEMDDTMLLETFSAINSYSSSEVTKKSHKKKHGHNLKKGRDLV